jgi:pimeloyl-ACP methyl ester carboxylesterase
MTQTRTLEVPGARLHYEVRGSGPLIVVAGAPMTAALFAPLAGALAGDHTVITLDPRGMGRSRLDDPERDSTPEDRADDVAAILDDLGAEAADMVGSSGGAVTGLALVARHPARVRTLVAHEPPVLDLLPDAANRHAATEQNISTYHRDGAEAAFLQFMATAGYDLDHLAESMPPGEPSEQDLADNNRFFTHELRGTTRYTPDIAALTAGPARVVVGVGAESGRLLTYRTSAALADRLGVTMTEFPGDHGGFIVHPQEFADVVRKVIEP